MTKKTTKKYRTLTPKEEWIMLHKGAEEPYSGEYNDIYLQGIYRCKRCNQPLYRSEDKFASGRGYPSFDKEIKNAVEQIPSVDRQKIEIICSTCGGHLGYIYFGEGFTSKNTRHSVNSASLWFELANR